MIPSCCDKLREHHEEMGKNRSPQTPFWRICYPGEECPDGFVRLPTYGSWGTVGLVDVDLAGIVVARKANDRVSETLVVFEDHCHLYICMPFEQVLRLCDCLGLVGD